MTQARSEHGSGLEAEPRDPETSVQFAVDVSVPIERAFHVFTADVDTWWPRTHHIGTADMAAAILEPRTGGRWYELDVDGSTCEWGRVLEWDPPRHVALSWRIDGEFRRPDDRSPASRVDVTFEARGADATRVTLTHSGLERHGETWRLLRERIGRGWPTLLRLYREAV